MHKTQLAALRRSIDEAVAAANGQESLAQGAMTAVRTGMDTYMINWCSVDPLTLLPTAFFVDRFPASMPKGISARPFFARDCDREAPLSVAQVARAARGIKTLNQTRDAGHTTLGGLLSRLAFSDELRLVLTDQNVVWGILTILRRGTTFTREEIDALAPLGPVLGNALRIQLLQRALQAPNAIEDPPGLMLLTDAGSIASISPSARRLLPDDAERGQYWQELLPVLASKAPPFSMNILGATGPVTLHRTTFQEQGAIIVERMRPLVLAEVLVNAFGLSPRERVVVQGVCAGLSTREIAFSLDLADSTVQDHLKSIFAKTKVSSRKKLVARLLRTHALPMHRQDAEPSPYGWFLANG